MKKERNHSRVTDIGIYYQRQSSEIIILMIINIVALFHCIVSDSGHLVVMR